MHPCQHLKSRKVKKHVKWDPTKGPIGLKSTKNGQKSTKTGQRVPQKQAKLEDPLENEEAAEATQGSRAIQADRAIRPGLANQPTATLEKKSPKLKTEVIEERATRYARTGAI